MNSPKPRRQPARHSARLPEWRSVPCAECCEPQMVREDIAGPVLCDACEMGGPIFGQKVGRLR